MLFRTLLVWGIGLPTMLLFFIVILISLIFDRSGNSVHSLGRLWSRIILSLSGVKVDVIGLENLPLGSPIILASNHQGAFDIPALQVHLPIQFRWVAKKSLFKIPVVGWSMSLAGYISIERKHAGKAYRSLEAAANKIKAGTSVLIFPEGTRSMTDELLPFKRGSFLMALKSRVPMVPVSIKGTRDIMKKGSIFIRPTRVKIVIGKSIPTEGMEEKELMGKVRRTIEEGLT